MAAGVIGIGQARVIAKVITDLPSALPEDVRVAGEATLVAHAAALNPAELARAGRYFASHVDPHGVARDDAEQRARSGITFASTDDHQDRWRVRIDEDTDRPVFDPPTWARRRGLPLPPRWQPDDGRPADS